MKNTEKNYFIIHTWMSSELGIVSLNNIAVYSVIYAFSKNSENTFYGSIKYLSKITTLSESTVKRCLNYLTEGGFIKKISFKVKGNITRCYYKAYINRLINEKGEIELRGVKANEVQKEEKPVSNRPANRVQSDTGTGVKLTYNNKSYNKIKEEEASSSDFVFSDSEEKIKEKFKRRGLEKLVEIYIVLYHEYFNADLGNSVQVNLYKSRRNLDLFTSLKKTFDRYEIENENDKILWMQAQFNKFYRWKKTPPHLTQIIDDKAFDTFIQYKAELLAA